MASLRVSRVDLNLRYSAPDPDRPTLFWVWLTLNFPRPDGLSDSIEFDWIGAIEDELTTLVAGGGGGVHAGPVTGDGRREFDYYLPMPNNAMKSIAGLVNRHFDYRFWHGSKDDPYWNQYLNLLYPNPEQLQKIGNGRLLTHSGGRATLSNSQEKCSTDSAVISLLRLSDRFRAHYDGWESQAIPSGAPYASPVLN